MNAWKANATNSYRIYRPGPTWKESHGAPVKRFVCGSIIPGCDRVFTGPGDQSVLDQALEHAALNHGLATAPMPFIELVLTYTRPFVPTDNRRHLRVVGRDEDASIVGGGLFTSGAGALARSSKAHNTYRHECLLYAGTGGFLDAVVPFVRDGLALQEPVLVAVDRAHGWRRCDPHWPTTPSG